MILVRSCEKQIIYLIACALHDTAPDESVVAGIDLEALFRLANAHSLTAVTCMGLEKGRALDSAPKDIAQKWKEAKAKAIRKNMLLDADRRKILDEMERAGIWYLPLKGCVLKDLYPKFGMRQMADNDILYDSSRLEDLKRIFREQGYSWQDAKGSVHDHFEKPPVYNFEMHRALFAHESYPVWDEKYSAVKNMCIPDEGKQFGFHLSDEDFYVYITAHAYKRFSNSGTGLCTLVDFYVYNLKQGRAMNRDYVDSELKSLGIYDYESISRRLADKLFAKPDPDFSDSLIDDEAEQLEYYLGSGTYGTVSNRVSKTMTEIQGDGKPIRGATRLKYILSRLFPGRQWCKDAYPFFYKYPVLLPILWVYRIFRGLIKRRKHIAGEIRAVKKQ